MEEFGFGIHSLDWPSSCSVSKCSASRPFLPQPIIMFAGPDFKSEKGWVVQHAPICGNCLRHCIRSCSIHIPSGPRRPNHISEHNCRTHSYFEQHRDRHHPKQPDQCSSAERRAEYQRTVFPGDRLHRVRSFVVLKFGSNHGHLQWRRDSTGCDQHRMGSQQYWQRVDAVRGLRFASFRTRRLHR